ncbi:MAG TPA: hypothetical protein VIG33_04960 [Pseudobdellovibrionaceae bacterium]|jgi:Zn-finger domain-containing protein
MCLKNEYLVQEIEEFLESISPGVDADELHEAIEEAKNLLEDESDAETIRNHLENLWDLIPMIEQKELEDTFSNIMNALESEMFGGGDDDNYFEDESEDDDL